MPSEKMIDFVEALVGQPEVAMVRGGENHWKIFIDLCKKMKAKGDIIPDLYLAALALEKGATWYSTDRDFAKIPRLQWQHPFEE